jgi:hypothetical protein
MIIYYLIGQAGKKTLEVSLRWLENTLIYFTSLLKFNWFFVCANFLRKQKTKDKMFMLYPIM